MSEIREDILRKRYYLKDEDGNVIEDWEGLCRRAASAVAQNEEEYKDFYEVLHECLFLPNTPTLTNAGKEKCSYSACFVLPIEDSMIGIFEAVKNTALIHQFGGGTGFDFSRIRPEGDLVRSTRGKASGPCSFIKVFDAATDTIKQGGTRRGANMGILRVDHPDIMDFINLKKEEGRISNFNLSIGTTDDFMSALKEDKEFNLVFKGKIRKTLKAREIWDAIVEGAWRNGEPGVVFLDTINRFNTTPHIGEIEATNPCVHGDTLVATPAGYKRADAFRIGDEIITVCGVGKVEKIEVNYVEPIYEVEFSDGGTIRVTGSHQFHAIKAGMGKHATKKFTPIPLKNLEIGDWVRVAATSTPKNTINLNTCGLSEREYGFLIGALIGDGTLTEKTLQRKTVKIASNKDDQQWNSYLDSLLRKVGYKGIVDESKDDKGIEFVINEKSPIWNIIQELEIGNKEAKEKVIPRQILNTNQEVLAGLIDGLFSADGNVNLSSAHPTLRYSTASRQLIADIRDILLMFGIHCSMGVDISHRASKIKGRAVKGGPKYEIIVAGGSIKTFYKHIGLTRPHKRQRLLEAVQHFSLTGNTWKTRITSIREAGSATVYDLYEPVTDTWITNGYVSRGCGEQPLLPYEACVLGSVNLSKMIKGSEVDWGKLGRTVRTAVRFLDNIVDAQHYPIPEIELTHKGNRKVGLGVMGWADMLIKLGIPYNSEEAVELAKHVMSFITNTSAQESIKLAEEKGVFPNWEGSVWNRKGIKIRNATTTTIAPTGSISIIAGCSSGIEPVFDFVTVQKRPVGEHKVIHSLYEEWLKEHGGHEPETVHGNRALPPQFVTAKEIPVDWHIRMQAAFQKYTHNAVSKTLNLPNSATREDVSEAFLMAYESGCKGVTIYRDGSRKEQVISSAKPVRVETDNLPAVLDAKRVRIDTAEGKIYVNVSLANKEPVEVFITTPFESKHSEIYESFGRIFSVALRNGVPATRLLSQLEKANIKYGSVSSIPAALIRAFRMLGINAGITVKDSEECPECKGVLVLEEGCVKCLSCGYTKC